MPDVQDLVDALRRALPAGATPVVQAIATGAVEQHRVSGSSVANTGVVIGTIRVDGRQ